MNSSHQNKFCASYEHGQVVINDDFDKYNLVYYSLDEYTTKLGNDASSSFSNLEIEICHSPINLQHFEQLISMLQERKKLIRDLIKIFNNSPNKNDQNTINENENQSKNTTSENKNQTEIIKIENDDSNIKQNSLDDSPILYLKSCFQCLKHKIPDKCIIGTVSILQQKYNDVIAFFNEPNKHSIKKLIDDIGQINCLLNRIINSINTIKSVQFNYLIFLQKAFNLLIALKDKFNEKCQKNLNDFLLNTVLIDCNQNPIFLFSKTSEKKTNLFDEFKSIYIEYFRKFQKKVNLDTFIFKLYERRIQNLDNENIYIDEFIKKDFTSFNDFLYSISKEFSPNFLENYKTKFSEKISKYNIFSNEIIPSIDCNISNDLNNWKYLVNINKYHIPLNGKNVFYIYQPIFDEIMTGKKELTKRNRSIHGMFINLIDEYVKMGNYYFFNVILSNAISRLLNKEDFSNKLQSILEEKKDDRELFKCDMNINSCANECLNFDNKFNFVIQRNYYETMNKIIIEREKKIFKANFSKFIVSCKNYDDDDHIYIPYFPNGTLHSLIKNNNIQSFLIVDKIVIILEISTALFDLNLNKEYHGNLSSQFIYIDSNKDAYIGAIAYDKNDESSCSKPAAPFYYHAPELDDSKNMITVDIYSFGILIYEIFSGKLSQQKMNGKRRDEIDKIMKYNYYEFLINGDEDKVFIDDSIDTKGNSLIGFKSIIEKCMKNDPNERFQSFDEIINCIKQTSIYSKNKEEIDFRLINAIPSSEYQCTFSNIAECYIKGNSNSLMLIQKILQKYCEIADTSFVSYEKTNIIKYILDTVDIKHSECSYSIFEYLILLFIRNNETMLQNSYNRQELTDEYWYTLLNINKYHLQNDNESIMTVLDSIFQFYLYYIGNNAQDSFFKRFLILTDDHKKNESKTFSLKDFLSLSKEYVDNSIKNKININKQFKDRIDELEKKGNYYYLSLIFQTTIRSILNQRLFSDKFHELLITNNNNFSEIYCVKDALCFNEINSSYKIYVDKDFIFVLQKTYNNHINKKIRDREKNIMKESYSKFIVHCEEDYQESKIIIPYFPLGSLDSIIKKKHQSYGYQKKYIELTNIDKIIILLEVAIALNDLHSNNEFHGNLASQLIFISSTKDAYIGSIAYDRKLESDSTKPFGPFYYRPPEMIFYEYYEKQGENIKKEQSLDIYSYGVLMHEIFTEISPEKRMGNKSREQRMLLLKNSYDQFLFDGKDNESFDDDSFDLNGDLLCGFKKIIEHCIKKDPKERYQSISEIITDIKQTKLYIENKEEIEYRINNAISSSEYQCTMSDLVESYYLGNENSIYDIEKSLSLYQKISTYDYFQSIQIEGDIIKSIFDTFEIKFEVSNNDYNSMNDMFKEIIIKNVKKDLYNNEDENKFKELLISSMTNLKKEIINIDSILPIASLESILQKKDVKKKLFPIWAYFIAHELSVIHLKGLYHGDMSTKSIGIYYNKKTKTLVPSIIPFCKKKKITNEKLIIDKNEFTEKMKKKDIKNIKKIIIELVGGNDSEIIKDLIGKIGSSSSMNEIIFCLYNFNLKNNEITELFKENHSNYSYSFFEFTFFDCCNIFDQFQIYNFSIENAFIDFWKMLFEANELIDIEINKSTEKYHKLVSNEKIDFNSRNIESLKKQFTQIKEKCNRYLIIKMQ